MFPATKRLTTGRTAADGPWILSFQPHGLFWQFSLRTPPERLGVGPAHAGHAGGDSWRSRAFLYAAYADVRFCTAAISFAWAFWVLSCCATRLRQDLKREFYSDSLRCFTRGWARRSGADPRFKSRVYVEAWLSGPPGKQQSSLIFNHVFQLRHIQYVQLMLLAYDESGAGERIQFARHCFTMGT